MKTRFDVYGQWISAYGEVLNVSEMETTHILNVLRMLIQKPSRTLSMLITDIEANSQSGPLTVWVPDRERIVSESISNVTSLSTDELKEFAKQSTLFRSMCDELCKRGVNVSNMLSILEGCDPF